LPGNFDTGSISDVHHYWIVGSETVTGLVYPDYVRARIRAEIGAELGICTAEAIARDASLLRSAEVIFGTWSLPVMDASLLAAAPSLKAIFYGAGSVKCFVTEELFAREIIVSSCAAANAVPVAEYTVGAILLGQKQFFRMAAETRRLRGHPKRELAARTMRGNYRTRVGLISFGLIARLVRERLKWFDLEVVVWDPFLADADAEAAGVTKVELDELFRTSDVVSLHTPWLKETENLIRGRHFRLMRPHALFINTARGAIVCEREMIDVLAERSDLTAVLDVTYPEPPASDSPLYSLPNVQLTPHIAGAMGVECARLGDLAVDEFLRWRTGQPLQHRIQPHMLASIA